MKRNIIMISALGIALSGYAATAPHSIWDSGMLKEAITAPAEVCAVTDKTMLLSGSYALRMDASCLPEKLEAFSVSAWVMPKSFDQYNELFRIESSEGRVLFSFQEKGTILSLGLYVNGTYQECDARINPESVLDGYWHFAAATFDGKEQRVYLDGALIGQLPHAGTAKVARGTGFVGSAGGYGEFFQGGLDDLRLYTTTLSPEQVTATFKMGAAQLTVLNLATLPDEWKSFLKERPTFSATLLAARQTLRQNNRACPPSVRNLFAMNLAARFPEACKNYTRLYNQAPIRFVTMPDLSALKSVMESQVTRLTEYMPLTDAQWARCPADERQHWQVLKTWADRMAARIPANEEALGPVLLDAVAADWPTVPERPSVAEPVAPYVVPATPDARTYTKEEARQTIENDWLFQVDGKPNLTGEIARTRALAARLCLPADALDAVAAEALKIPLSMEKNKELYLAVRRIKRGLMLSNPVINFHQLLLVDMPYPAGREWQHETRHRLGYMAVPGGQLLVVDGLSLEGKVQRLMPQAPLHGSFWRPDLSFDGRRVLFCFKPHNEKAFHIYEINVDGTGLRQITSGIFDDFDPIYLPDGKNFVFSSTRGHTYVRCMPPTNAYMLMRCGLDGENLYFISANNEPDYLPTVMNDGRLIYTRWEYTDKPLWRAQSLWTVNPDGTQPNTFWGNQSVWPDLLKDARSIPGSRRVMFTGSAHHNWFAGSIGIINPDKGANFPNGLTKVTTELTWPESGNGPSDPIESPDYQAYGKIDAYQNPYPLCEKDFLVSARRAGKFILYLMDTDGNRELVYEGANNIFHAQPLRSRVTPPALQDRVNWPTMAERLEPQGGSIYSANVYSGAPAALQGKAKFLRILHIEQKTYTYWNRRPALSTGPVVSLLQSDGVKRVLGTVPIHPDGSCWFRVPSGVALHFQLLDDQQRALQTMRSFVNIMPGETRGCLGCHEQQMGAARAKAVPRVADVITPVPWAYATGFIVAPEGCKTLAQVLENGAIAAAQADTQKAAHTARFGTSVSYLKDVQPVLDRYCGKCHQGDGEARKKLDLTLRGYEPYTTLIGRPGWGRTNAVPENVPGYDLAGTLKVENYSTVDPAAYLTPAPMTRLSYTSKLVELASSGKHHQVKVDPYSLLRLILWVDTMCTYLSDEDVRAEEDPQFQGSDWLSIKPRLKTAPTVIRPGPFHANAPGIE
ncbi:MAG: LamG-like jellyroll fold domain-containing protein [bacterium]